MSSYFRLIIIFIIYVTQLKYLPTTAFEWELGVASEGRLDLISTSGTILSSVANHELSEARGLALDAARQVLFFSNGSPDNGSSVFTLQLSNMTGATVIGPLVQSREEELIQSLAFDPVNSDLYWTDSDAQAIFWMHIDPKEEPRVEGKILHEFKDELPLGLAIDSCRRLLFWSNVDYRRPTIERSSLDGTERQIIVRKDLFQPHGLTLDPAYGGRLYWGHDHDGSSFSLERCALDGSERELLIKGVHHTPFSLALLGSNLFWSDWNNAAIWKLDLRRGQKAEAVQVMKLLSRPYGIIAFPSNNNTSCINNEVVMHDTSTATPTTTTLSSRVSAGDFCLSGGKLSIAGQCMCPLGFSGSHCEINECHNYCFHGGECLPGSPPRCICEMGRRGERCEIDPCQGYCLNGGTCYHVTVNKHVCHCDERFSGSRCEMRRDVCGDQCDCREGGDKPCLCESLLLQENSTLANDSSSILACSALSQHNGGSPLEIAVISVSSVCCVLLIVVAVLLWRVRKLSRRPRIRRRVVVSRKEVMVPPGHGGRGEEPSASKSSPSSRPASDTCEITIENCCNMNVCETPCFEPPGVRTPSKKVSKKEEKNSLLSNMGDADYIDDLTE